MVPSGSVGIRVESIGDRHRARAVASDQSALPGSLIQRGPWAHARFLRDPAIVASGLWCIRPRPRLYRMYFDAEPGHPVDRRRPGPPREFADRSPGAEQSTADSDRAPSSRRVRRGHGPQVPVRWSPHRGSEGHSSGKAPTRLGCVEPLAGQQRPARMSAMALVILSAGPAHRGCPRPHDCCLSACRWLCRSPRRATEAPPARWRAATGTHAGE